MMTAPAIQTINLSKKYKEKFAVKNFNLTIPKGELFSLLGVNGAGKSTVIKMLACLIKPSNGEAILLGENINKNTAKIKQMISISPQETAIAMNLTVRENLELIAGIYGYSLKEAKEKATEYMNTFTLSSIEKQKAKTLSGGWQRRLSIAMALISNPKILFLDEPTLGLDIIARRQLWEAIESLKGKVTIILTTHYLEEAEALSDRIGIMSAGELLQVGTVSELINAAHTNQFEDAFIALCNLKGEENK